MMANRFGVLGLIVLLISAVAAGCTCTDEVSEDEGFPDLPQLDDDTAIDDVADDAADDTDDDSDDTGDDTGDDTDVEYASLVCPIPDPMSLGEGNMIGGGSPTTQIDVYVYDDGTCEPLEGAEVLHGGTIYLTDNTGHAVVALSKAAETVTAWAANSWAWSYKADAAVMYFRLRPDAYNRVYADSATGDFLDGGDPIALTNPVLADLFSQPLYAGLVLPGISRRDVLSLDDIGLFTQATFNFAIDSGDGPVNWPLPLNVYLPTLDLEFSADYSIAGGNEHYAVPVMDGGTASPIEGLIARMYVNQAIPNITDLLTFLACLDGGDILECIAPFVVPIVNDALTIRYLGANPTWDGTGAPNMDTLRVNTLLPLTIANASGDFDYFAAVGPDIPNRALIPTGIGFAEGGTVDLGYTEIPNADYIAFVAETDLIESDFAAANMNFAFKYAETISGWTEGVSFDADADFLPWFDGGNTSYDDSTGLVSWALDGSGPLTPDIYMVVFVPGPSCAGCKVIFAQTPGDTTSYQIPTTELNITPSADDMVAVFGFAMPDDFNGGAYSPAGVLGYNIKAINMWTNFDLLSFITLP